MEDQVKSLEAKGIKALMLRSKLNRHDTIVAFDNLQYGNYKFLYLSPEKLQSEFIQEKISQLHLNLIAIDEAHMFISRYKQSRNDLVDSLIERQMRMSRKYGLGFMIAIVLMAGIREELELCDVPQSLRGAPITP